jgi:hypothetical protein
MLLALVGWEPTAGFSRSANTSSWLQLNQPWHFLEVGADRAIGWMLQSCKTSQRVGKWHGRHL